MSESDDSSVFDIKCRDRPSKKVKTSSDTKSLFISESSVGVFRLEQKIGAAGGRPRDLEVPNAQLEVISRMLSTHQELIASQLVKTELISTQFIKVQGCLDQVLKELEFLKYATVSSKIPESSPLFCPPIQEENAALSIKIPEGLPQALPPIPEEDATVPPIPEEDPEEVATVPSKICDGLPQALTPNPEEPEVVDIPLQKPTPTKKSAPTPETVKSVRKALANSGKALPKPKGRLRKTSSEV